MSDGKVHSKLGASSYDRWGACPGSVAASVGIPNVSSVYAEEGTFAHEVAATSLLGQTLDNMAIPDEMMDAVQVYLDHINDLRAHHPTFEAVEQKLSLAALHPQLFGTADYVCYFADTKTLHVVDYKHGRGIPVQVVGNKQLRYYGLGALHMNSFPVERVVLTIVQPRCYHPQGPVRSDTVDAVEMMDFAADLVSDAKLTEAPNAPTIAGEHCRFCPAQPTCPTVQAQATQVVTAAFKNESLPALPPERVAHYLSLVPQIESWCKAVTVYAHQQAALGNPPPGWKLVDKVARRKWKEDTNVFILSQALEKDESKFYGERELMSPSQVEKSLGLNKEQKLVLNSFVTKESSGKTLVSTSDERAAVDGQLSFALKQE